MTIQYLLHDPLFYVLLAFLVEHGIVSFVVYRFLKPYASMLRFMSHKPTNAPKKVDPVIEGMIARSSLREKLNGTDNRPKRASADIR